MKNVSNFFEGFVYNVLGSIVIGLIFVIGIFIFYNLYCNSGRHIYKYNKNKITCEAHEHNENNNSALFFSKINSDIKYINDINIYIILFLCFFIGQILNSLGETIIETFGFQSSMNYCNDKDVNKTCNDKIEDENIDEIFESANFCNNSKQITYKKFLGFAGKYKNNYSEWFYQLSRFFSGIAVIGFIFTISFGYLLEITATWHHLLDFSLMVIGLLAVSCVLIVYFKKNKKTCFINRKNIPNYHNHEKSLMHSNIYKKIAVILIFICITIILSTVLYLIQNCLYINIFFNLTLIMLIVSLFFMVFGIYIAILYRETANKIIFYS